MNIEIKIDGSIWMELNVNDKVAPEVIKELENACQQIINSQNKNLITRAVHQLRKKYG